MTYPGGKAGTGVYQRIISEMPPHQVYIEAFLGSGAILRKKKPAKTNIGIEIDNEVIKEFWSESLPNFQILNENSLGYLKLLAYGNQTLKNLTSNPKDVLIYCDPPYLGSVRSSQRQIYSCDMMDENEHFNLLQILRHLKCNVMISGYDSDLYNRFLPEWRKITYKAPTRGGTWAIECLWMNFAKPLELHDYSYLGNDHRERYNIKRRRNRWKNKLLKMDEAERFALLASLEELRGPRAKDGVTSAPREITPLLELSPTDRI